MQCIVSYASGIRSYLKSVLRYIFLILDTYHPDTLCEQECEDPWLFFEAKRGPGAKRFGKHWHTVFRCFVWQAKPIMSVKYLRRSTEIMLSTKVYITGGTHVGELQDRWPCVRRACPTPYPRQQQDLHECATGLSLPGVLVGVRVFIRTFVYCTGWFKSFHARGKWSLYLQNMLCMGIITLIAHMYVSFSLMAISL